MTPAQYPSGRLVAVEDKAFHQPPTLFYQTACINERQRSNPGPMRRPLVVPWKLRHIQATYSLRRRHRCQFTMMTIGPQWMKTSSAKKCKTVTELKQMKFRKYYFASKQFFTRSNFLKIYRRQTVYVLNFLFVVDSILFENNNFFLTNFAAHTVRNRALEAALSHVKQLNIHESCNFHELHHFKLNLKRK